MKWILSFLPNSKGSPSARKEKKKEARVWENAGTAKDLKILDFSEANGKESNGQADVQEDLESMVSRAQTSYWSVKVPEKRQ